MARLNTLHVARFAHPRPRANCTSTCSACRAAVDFAAATAQLVVTYGSGVAGVAFEGANEDRNTTPPRNTSRREIATCCDCSNTATWLNSVQLDCTCWCHQCCLLGRLNETLDSDNTIFHSEHGSHAHRRWHDVKPAGTLSGGYRG